VTATLWVQVMGFVTTIVVAILGYLSIRGKVDKVHTLVNGEHQSVVERNAQLEDTLSDAGIKLPPNRSPRA
jgi:hypothetical protein